MIRVMDFSGQYLSQTEYFSVSAKGMTRQVVLDDLPRPNPDLQGIVLDANGNPAAGVVVSLQPDTGGLGCKCYKYKETTDEDGMFNFGSFLAGKHRLFVSHADSHRPLTSYHMARPGESVVIYLPVE